MISAHLVMCLTLGTFGLAMTFATWQKVKVEQQKESGEVPELADLDRYKN